MTTLIHRPLDLQREYDAILMERQLAFLGRFGIGGARTIGSIWERIGN